MSSKIANFIFVFKNDFELHKNLLFNSQFFSNRYVSNFYFFFIFNFQGYKVLKTVSRIYNIKIVFETLFLKI